MTFGSRLASTPMGFMAPSPIARSQVMGIRWNGAGGALGAARSPTICSGFSKNVPSPWTPSFTARWGTGDRDQA
jgi:hypothetical protein